MCRYKLAARHLATVSLLYKMQVPRLFHSWVTNPLLLGVLEVLLCSSPPDPIAQAPGLSFEC